MSQQRNPPDTQALLQSMLQRLRLQPGRDGQANLYTPPNATWGQDGEKGPSDLQKVNSSPVNGFVTNGNSSKVFGIPAADSNFLLKVGETQRPGQGGEVDRDSRVSFPTQKDNIDGDTGENKALGQAAQSGITPTGTGQLFPAKSLNDVDITSFERTDGERLSFGRQSLNQYRGFTPKSFVWSLKNSDANREAGGHEDKALHVGNGGFGALAQSKDMQIVPTDQTTTNSSTRRKQRSSENKTRRWTQKIKERWRDRPGISGKKEKDGEGREDLRLAQGTEPLTAETHNNTSHKEEERILPSVDSNDPGKALLTEDGTNMRSTGDFEFGLGSFSLLEEIVTGQEWAKFLNPNQSVPSANQRPLEEPKLETHDGSQSPVILNQHGGLCFRGTEASPVASPSDFSMAQTSSGGFLPVSMDVSEGKQAQRAHKETDQSEPMEDGHTQSEARSGHSGLRQRLGPPSFAQPADILNNSALKSRVQLNRKRQHQSAERLDERPQTEKTSDWADTASPTSSLRPSSSQEMEEHDNVGPSTPSAFTPFAPAPKGVLKHTISQDSEASMEIVTKRRRVEENRRVRFSEEVLTIEPPEMDLDATDSEEDSVEEEDSVIEQECEVEPAEQAPVEEVAPARRPAIPAWILALRRSTGRKHR